MDFFSQNKMKQKKNKNVQIYLSYAVRMPTEKLYFNFINIFFIEMQKRTAQVQHSLRRSHWVLLLLFGFPAAIHTNAPFASDA